MYNSPVRKNPLQVAKYANTTSHTLFFFSNFLEPGLWPYGLLVKVSGSESGDLGSNPDEY